jgi:Phage major capsid protein E
MADMMLDFFGTDAFSLVSLSDQIMKLKFVPGRLGQLRIFNEFGVSTTSIDIEEKGQILDLVAPSPRGGTGSTLDKALRTLRTLKVPHFELNGGITAEEVQNVRAFGNTSALETVMNKVNEHMSSMASSLDITLEYARVGAVKGIVTYKDGSTLNLFNEFGVTPPATIAFDLTNATASPGALRMVCQKLLRDIAYALDGVPYTGVRAMCGDDFFDALIANSEVRSTYLNWGAAGDLRQSYISSGNAIFGTFEFAGITWENYRGSYAGSPFFDTDKAYFIVEGVPGLYRTAFAPADYIETVNTMGQSRYARMRPTENMKGYYIDVQSNFLCYMTRPNACFKGTM